MQLFTPKIINPFDLHSSSDHSPRVPLRNHPHPYYRPPDPSARSTKKTKDARVVGNNNRSTHTAVVWGIPFEPFDRTDTCPFLLLLLFLVLFWRVLFACHVNTRGCRTIGVGVQPYKRPHVCVRVGLKHRSRCVSARRHLFLVDV